MYVQRPQCSPTRDTQQVVNGKIINYLVSTWHTFKYFILPKGNFKLNIKHIKPNWTVNINYSTV